MLHPIDVPKPEIATGLFHLGYPDGIRIPGRMRFIAAARQTGKPEYHHSYKLKYLAHNTLHFTCSVYI